MNISQSSKDLSEIVYPSLKRLEKRGKPQSSFRMNRSSTKSSTLSLRLTPITPKSQLKNDSSNEIYFNKVNTLKIVPEESTKKLKTHESAAFFPLRVNQLRKDSMNEVNLHKKLAQDRKMTFVKNCLQGSSSKKLKISCQETDKKEVDKKEFEERLRNLLISQEVKAIALKNEAFKERNISEFAEYIQTIFNETIKKYEVKPLGTMKMDFKHYK